MRKLIVVSTLALGVIVAACERAADTLTAPPQQPSTSSGPVVASAHGGGKATAAGGSTYHFAFAAAYRSDGSTKGHVKLRIGDTRYDADVVCLGVRGDTAVIVGVVSSSSDAGAVGDSLVFTAIDGTARISEPKFPTAGTAGLRCSTVSASATVAVEQGNVHVEGSTPVIDPEVGASVVGMGSGNLEVGTPFDFTTNVLRAPDGTVSGQHRLDYPPDVTPRYIVLTASCLTVSGDSALIGGTITDSDVGVFIGREGGVIMFDRAPATPDPDQTSDTYIDSDIAQLFCDNNLPPLSLQDLTAGDLAVLP